VDEIMGRATSKPKAEVEEMAVISGLTPSEEEVLEAEGELLSGEDALAWLESLTIGKEDELRAQAEAESQARVDEIMGRPPAKPRATVEKIVSPKEIAPAAAPGLSVAEGEMLSGDDALAWLESLTIGKEDELRAQAEAESQARVDEIMGRTPTQPQAIVEAVAPVEKEPAEMEITETALEESDLAVSPDDQFQMAEEAPSWLDRVAGKESPAAVMEAPESDKGIEVKPPSVAREPSLREIPAPQPIAEAAKAKKTPPEAEKEGFFGWSGFDAEIAETDRVTEPDVMEMEEESITVFGFTSFDEQEEAGTEAPSEEVVEAPQKEEPVAAEVTELPAAVAGKPEPESAPSVAAVPIAEKREPGIDIDIEALKATVKKHRSDHEARLTLARALWQTGETEEALGHYSRLIRNKAFVDDIQSDLEKCLTAASENARLFQVLGDAYMQNDQLDDALEAYKTAMNLL
ncbi:MAG: tetratricopeptide repeat protein, partial [Anaerolineae bacterium]|nr:tetratricopeptide repeat protein [Anaerolineae bacterium]